MPSVKSICVRPVNALAYERAVFSQHLTTLKLYGCGVSSMECFSSLVNLKELVILQGHRRNTFTHIWRKSRLFRQVCFPFLPTSFSFAHIDKIDYFDIG